jgi:HEAT repeat protein
MKDLNFFVTNFIKSIKNHKLYEKVSETTKEFIEKCYLNLKKAQEEAGTVVLIINEDKIMNDSKVLHSDPKQLTSIPLFLYRNGLRSLAFLEGISKEELEELVKIIASREYSSEVGLLEDLWQSKFPHIIYHAVEKTKKISEYDDDIKPPSEVKSEDVAILPVKIKRKNSPKKNEQGTGLKYEQKISIDREHSSFLLIESIKDLLSYETNHKKRGSLYLILKDSIPGFLKSGNLSALHQTKSLIENQKETKKEFIESLNQIKKIITSEAARQLYIHALTSSTSNRIKSEAVELLECIGDAAVDDLINELEITSDFIVKNLIISLLKNIFTEHKKELEVRLVNTEGKTLSALLLIVKKLKDPYFLPSLKELFEKKNIPQVKDVLFSLLSRKDIITYLDHPDPSVRITSLERLKAIWTPEEFEIIRNRIMTKKFWHLSKEEIKALMELLSTLKTDDTIKIFSSILRKRHFFREKIYDIKKIALEALSNINEEKALELISRYRNSRILKEKVTEILKKYETE